MGSHSYDNTRTNSTHTNESVSHMFHSNYMTVFLLICFTTSIVQAQDKLKWQQKYDKHGIIAMTRKVDGSAYLEYKIETNIEGSTVDEALTLITDINQYKTIFPYLDQAELLSEYNETSYDVLVVIKTPFPVKNRIGVYTNTIHREEQFASINIIQNEELIPETKYVNIKKCYGSWAIQESENGFLSISHTFFADPGGSIPAWIINSFALKQPINTFKILKEILTR